MRLRRDGLLILGLLTAVCLLGGVVIGIGTGRFAQAAPSASPTAEPATPTPVLPPSLALAGTQRSLLIVGVSDAGAAAPSIEGCWVVTFSPGDGTFYVLSFPTDAKFQLSSLPNSRTLSDIYIQDMQQQLGYRFMRDAIQSRFPALNIRTEITLDRNDVTDLVSKVGGLSLGGRTLAGAGLLAAYDSAAPQGMAARMDFQHQVFEKLFNALADEHWTPSSLFIYLAQAPHALRAEDSGEFNNFAATAPPLLNGQLSWTVYTPELETATTP
jgi:hypothetical protein